MRCCQLSHIKSDQHVVSNKSNKMHFNIKKVQSCM